MDRKKHSLNQFSASQTNFQPKATISLRLAGVRTKCFYKNGEREIPCSDKTFIFKEVDGCANQSRVGWSSRGHCTNVEDHLLLDWKRRRPFHRAGRWWPLLFGMHKKLSLLTICRRVKQSQGNIIQQNPFLSKQRTGSHSRSFNGKSAWIRL